MPTVPLLNGVRPPGNSFVLPEHRIVYISVTKVACTSLRWMVADLAGEDFERFHRATGGQQTRLMTVHGRRDRWQKTPQLKDLPPDVLADIAPHDGWFVFAVVRDPWSRLWSAWQSKFLVRHTFYMKNFANEPWFPRVPTSAKEIVEDFQGFVEARPWLSHPQLKQDVHFKPQAYSVRPEGVNYTRIYDVSEMHALFHDIGRHLESVGRPSELYVPRANENPLGMTAEVLGGGVAEAVEELYSADIEAFGKHWSRDRLKLVPDGWTPDAVRLVQFHTIANERIGDLHREASRLRRRLGRRSKQLAAARQQISALQNGSATGRARGRRLLDRLLG